MNLTVRSWSIMAAVVLRVNVSWTSTFIKEWEHIILSDEEYIGSVRRVLNLESNGHLFETYWRYCVVSLSSAYYWCNPGRQKKSRHDVTSSTGTKVSLQAKLCLLWQSGKVDLATIGLQDNCLIHYYKNDNYKGLKNQAHWYFSISMSTEWPPSLLFAYAMRRDGHRVSRF